MQPDGASCLATCPDGYSEDTTANECRGWCLSVIEPDAEPGSLVFGLWSLVFGLWSLVFGLWSLIMINVNHELDLDFGLGRNIGTGIGIGIVTGPFASVYIVYHFGA